MLEHLIYCNNYVYDIMFNVCRHSDIMQRLYVQVNNVKIK